MTALYPHQGNKQFIIPKRFGLIPTDSTHKSDSVNNSFRSNEVSGTLVATGFVVTNNNIPVLITSVDQIDGPRSIVVHHAIFNPGDFTTLTYDGSGDWIGDNGRKVGKFSTTGIV